MVKSPTKPHIFSFDVFSNLDLIILSTSKRENYLFNSSINGIEEADLILIVGANPRYEATILNARIRKAFLNNNTKIISLNDVGDLTYPYQSLDGQTQTLNNILEGNHDISKEIINSKKPIIIIGESLLRLESSEFLFNKTKILKNIKLTAPTLFTNPYNIEKSIDICLRIPVTVYKNSIKANISIID